MLNWLSQITIGEVIFAYLACAMIHELMVALLPDSIAGPGGWLIDTAGLRD